MHRHRNDSRYQASTNDSYESDVEKIDGGKKSRKSAYDNDANYVEDLDDEEDQYFPPLPLSQPTKNTYSVDNLAKSNLSNIPEEIEKTRSIEDRNQDNPVETNMEFKNMSISNFKLLHVNDQIISNSNTEELRRNASHTSIINMKQIQPDPQLQTGKNFRKVSTVLITPKGDERLSIRILDRQNVPELFIQLDSLYLNQVTNSYYWMEKYRWIKFEEDYNHESQHFSSPHLSPLTIKSIKQFRKTFSKGEMILDCNSEEFTSLLTDVTNSINQSGTFSEEEMRGIRDALIFRHNHVRDHLITSPSDLSMYRHQFDQATRKRSNTSFTMLEGIQRKLSHAKLEGKLEPGTECLSVQVGALESLNRTFSLLVRLNIPIKAGDFVEIDCPLRFLFLIFGPKSKEDDLIEIGRVFAVMMSNVEFREVGYSANTKEDILTATKIFVTHSALVPLNKLMSFETIAAMLPHLKHYLNCLISEQNQKIFDEMKKEMALKNQKITLSQMVNGIHKKVSVSSLALSPSSLSENQNHDKEEDEGITEDTKKNKAKRVIRQFWPPFRNFIADIKGFKLRFTSDFSDAFKKDNAPIVFIAILFIYFVVMAPAITFGALLNAVNPQMTVSMMLLASGFFQFFFAFLGGQPFEIVGITGPVYAVEKVLGSLASSIDMPLAPMRFWIGIYVAILGIITITFNGTIILKHIRRSVEEIYNFLVALIFILSALFNMFKVLPYTITPLALNNTNAAVIVTERLKFGIGGSNLFLAFFMANFCVFLIKIKKGTFYRRKIRMLLGSLNVPLGIILIIILNQIFFRSYSLPTLNVPPSNAINFSLWFNIPSVSSIFNVSSTGHGLCFMISLSLFAIIMCEISCNAILATRAERKLLKPSLFSLNFFYLLVLFPIVSGTLGWPFMSGGTVRSHVHCMALTLWSLRLPGVPAKITGAIEQRISGSIVGIMALLSVFLGTILQYIPMASMYGMFLYMGLMGSVDLVMIRRAINILRRRKYWKDHNFLKDIPTWNITIFVSIQLFTMAVLVLLNCISEFTIYFWTPLLYPWTIILFAFIRGYILPHWPRLNTHLSKMDKKHPVKLFYEIKAVENIILTVDETKHDIKIVETVVENRAYEKDEDDSEDFNIEDKDMF